MYLDTDVIVALLKADDWLQAAAEGAAFEALKTSLISGIDIHLVMFESWSRSQLADLLAAIEREGVSVIPLTADAMSAGTDLLTVYSDMNVLDAAHLGHARTLDEPIVSTDTLYPKIEEVDHIDFREL